MEDRFEEVFAEIPVVRKALGWIPLVTPTSQIVGTQSVINVLTGERADITIGTMYTVDNSAIRTLAAAKTAVHMHLAQTALGASAGYLLYSGRIDQVSLAGREGQLYQFSMTYHANDWSAYG